MVFWHWPGISTCGDEKTKLHINQACLEITSLAPGPVQFESQTTECQGCVYMNHGTIIPNTTNYYVIDTSYPMNIKLSENEEKTLITYRFDDFGLYSLDYYKKEKWKLEVKNEPEYFWMNISTILVICVILAALTKLVVIAVKRQWITRLIYRNVSFEELQTEASPERRNDARTRRLGRVATIDVFRGIAITLMIFVNYGGGQYAVFKHAPWNGLTIADVVFPFFIFIMGVSTVINLWARLRAGIGRKKIFMKVMTRSIFLVALGLVLNSGKLSDDALRLPGVLQRIGFTYLILASVEIFFGRPQRSERYGPWKLCSELTDAIFQWGAVVILAIAHVAITLYLPVPGCPTGYLGPGGLSNGSDHPNCTGGAAGYIDRLILTPQHIYQRPTSQKIYKSDVPFDPEGILGLLTSVIMALLGAHCGRIILSYEQNRSRVVRWLLSSAIAGIAAGLLCSFSKNGGIIPVNKNLWSLSFVLATASMAFFLITVLYWLVDSSQYWNGRPFVYAGMNSIAMYLGHEILNKHLPWRWTPITQTHFEILAMDVSATIFWVLISYFMYINNIFISL